MLIGRSPYSNIVGLLLTTLGRFVTLKGNLLGVFVDTPHRIATGLALIVSGVLVTIDDARGPWLFIGTWLTTLAWSLWEVGFDPFRLISRVVAPFILLLLILASRVFSLSRPLVGPTAQPLQ